MYQALTTLAQSQPMQGLPAMSLTIDQILIGAGILIVVAAMIPNPFQKPAAWVLSFFTGKADTNNDGKVTPEEIAGNVANVASLVRRLGGGDKAVMIDLLKLLTEEHTQRVDIDLSTEIAALWAKLLNQEATSARAVPQQLPSTRPVVPSN